MPKTNDASGPTYYGMEGHVVDSHDRVHEVDPSRTVTGEVVEGYESDEREMEERKVTSDETRPAISPSDGLPAGPTPSNAPPLGQAELRAQEAAAEGESDASGTKREEKDQEQVRDSEEESPSRGSSSRTSRVNSAPSAAKKTSGK